MTGVRDLEELLLPRIARGETAAVDSFLDRYGGLVWSLAKRLSPDDAEDAVQEVFVELWRNASRFRAEAGSEVAFVSTVARRRLIDRRRRSSRAPEVVALAESQAAKGYASPVLRMIDVEEKTQLHRCLGGLGNRERELLELSVYEGQSQSQIAERLQTPLGTVKSLIRRALIRIRDCMHASFRVEGGVAT